MKIPFFLKSRASINSFTLIVLFPSRLIRADVTGGPRPKIVELWETPAPSGETPALLVDAALALGPAKGRAVFVLASSVWTQVLQVPPNKVAGLSLPEVENALSFEAEALSGINPFDSAIGHQSSASTSPGDRGFWVTQISAVELQQIEASLAQKGSVLAGLLHPGGLPRSWSQHAVDGGAWQRVELWNDVAFAIDAPEGAPARVHALVSSPGRGGWEAEVDQWFAGQSSKSPREVLALDPKQLAGAAGTGISLSDDAALRGWLLAWATELSSATPHVPIVRPPPKPVSDRSRAMIGVSLAVTVLVLCVGHALWLRKRQASLSTELERSEAPEKKLASLKTQITGLERDLDAVRRQGAALRALKADWTVSITRERRRHATLLAILTDNTPEDLTISAIDESGGQLKLSGLALQPHFEAFATSLAAGIDPLGWRYEPPRRRALNLSSDGGPWMLDWSLALNTNQLGLTNVASFVPAALTAAPNPTPAPASAPSTPRNRNVRAPR